MPISPLPGAFSQKTWPGVGDIDDCWVIATYWALVAAGVTTKAKLPSVAAFRAVAGVPDVTGSADGGTPAQTLKAAKSFYPDAGTYGWVGDLAGFQTRLNAGQVVSLSVKSSLLPAALQYGFAGAHQVAVAKVGATVRLMNPLMADGTQPASISWVDLQRAAGGLYGDSKFHCVWVPMKEAALDPHIAEIAALKAQITALENQLGSRDATIATLTAKIAAVRNAIL